MPTGPVELMDEVIRHLEGLRADGVRWVSVRPETLASLAPAAVTARSNRPAALPSPPQPRTVSGAPAPVAPVASGASDPVSSFESSTPVGPRTQSRPIPGSVVARWARSSSNPVSPTPAVPVSKSVPVPTHPPLPPPLDPAAKVAALADLREQALACVRCPNLAASRKSVVFGVGDVHARLLFVGEAPGADEDLQGEPFVGKAGELLTRMIGAMGLSRSDVYIANILKCRPDTPGQTSGNRKPMPDEMATCIPWLHRQVDIIQPGAIVALGATAVEGLLGKTVGITRLRGTWQQYRGIPLMPTYHPAYLLRNQAPSEKRKVWEDLMAAMEILRLPITEKQRGFFLSKI